MKKRAVLFVIILSIISIIYIFIKNEQEKEASNNEIVFLGSYLIDIEEEINKIYSNYEEFKKMYGPNILKKSNFKDNNYIVVKLNSNACDNIDMQIVQYGLIHDTMYISAVHNTICTTCINQYYYYAIKIDKNINQLNTSIKYNENKTSTCNDYKPEE